MSMQANVFESRWIPASAGMTKIYQAHLRDKRRKASVASRRSKAAAPAVRIYWIVICFAALACFFGSVNSRMPFSYLASTLSRSTSCPSRNARASVP